MIKLKEYIKPYILNIILLVILLFIQANANLALPNYMAEIVDEGIQKGGISAEIPEYLTEKTHNRIKSILNYEDREIFENSYKKKNKNQIEIKYFNPDLNKEDNIYELVEDDKELDRIIESSIFKLFNRDDKNLTSTMKEMYMNHFIKAEYKELGIDMNKIQIDYLFKTGFKMILIALGSMLAAVIVVIIASKIAAGVGRDLRNSVFRKVMSFSDKEIDKFSISSLINRSTNDIQQIQLFLVLFLRLVFYAPILGIGGIIKVFKTNLSMSWIIPLAAIAITLVMLIIFSVAVPRFKLIQKLLDKLNLVTRESITGLLVIRAYNNEKLEEEKFDITNEELSNTTKFVGRIMGLLMPAMTLIMNIIMIIVVWYGSYQIDLGKLEIGDMMAFIQYSMQIIMSFLMISMISVLFPRSSVAANRIAEILDMEISIKDPLLAEEIIKSKRGEIEFKNIGFKYPYAEKNVLKNISFKIEKGDKVAIIGGTGSGKSTIVKLLNRFYDPTEGSIEIAGVDIRNMNQKELRKMVGYVPQKSFLFSGDINSNIKFGNEKIKEEDIIKSAEIAQAKEFIEKKEEKYDSEISEMGANLSGGQKQRLSIARAIAKKPDIIIFDDSFSALDFTTESKLRSELDRNLKDTTTILISQRINSIKNSDKIIVLKDGELDGIGKHDELIKNSKTYKEIALSQLAEEELNYETEKR
ncbi:MAG: ABC transporter ATP-binding protein [Andreesenia angusta]|nr:ABC transporter ATP-binding protein [Andreesenia angusta]